MAPELLRGEEATPAADAYSLGVMFVHLLTGIWYEPGSKVFRLLETLEYRWIDVLPQLLAENPTERPSKLVELAQRLRNGGEATSPSLQNKEVRPVQKRRGRRFSTWFVALVGAAILVVVGFFLFRRIAFSAADQSGDDFSSDGIYEVPPT